MILNSKTDGFWRQPGLTMEREARLKGDTILRWRNRRRASNQCKHRQNISDCVFPFGVNLFVCVCTSIRRVRVWEPSRHRLRGRLDIGFAFALTSASHYYDIGFAFILTSASHSFWYRLRRIVLTSASRSSWHRLRIILTSASHSSWHRLRIRLDIGFAEWYWHRLRILLDIGFALYWHRLRIHPDINFAFVLTSAPQKNTDIGYIVFALSCHRPRT